MLVHTHCLLGTVKLRLQNEPHFRSCEAEMLPRTTSDQEEKNVIFKSLPSDLNVIYLNGLLTYY